jgi:hypothetical protein
MVTDDAGDPSDWTAMARTRLLGEDVTGRHVVGVVVREDHSVKLSCVPGAHAELVTLSADLARAPSTV